MELNSGVLGIRRGVIFWWWWLNAYIGVFVLICTGIT
jgi:hypothetical protein